MRRLNLKQLIIQILRKQFQQSHQMIKETSQQPSTPFLTIPIDYTSKNLAVTHHENQMKLHLQQTMISWAQNSNFHHLKTIQKPT